MEAKFFPRDVKGKQPKKVGDLFKAEFFGATRNFRVTSHHGNFFFAEVDMF